MAQVMPIVMIGDDLRFTYRNWRGEVAVRNARVEVIQWGSTEWHPEPQWLLLGFDYDKAEERFFAMKDMSDVVRLND